tara:strand:+ start:22848 stop:23657 length:810 start_codon:yes stop_codon:yes gene_type:complete
MFSVKNSLKFVIRVKILYANHVIAKQKICLSQFLRKMTKTNSLIIIRHGQSVWNEKNLFTGWEDADLTNLGRKEAINAANILKKSNFVFDLAYTSLLSRAIKTLWITLDELNQAWIPIRKCWEINERHYGHLTGLNKVKMEREFGSDIVKNWRKSYAYCPLPIEEDSNLWAGLDSRYDNIDPKLIPTAESLKDTVVRVKKFWIENIVSDLIEGKRIIISAHGNSIRALLMYVENITPEAIEEINIPRAIPIHLKFSCDGTFLSRKFLEV